MDFMELKTCILHGKMRDGCEARCDPGIFRVYTV